MNGVVARPFFRLLRDDVTNASYRKALVSDVSPSSLFERESRIDSGEGILEYVIVQEQSNECTIDSLNLLRV